MATLSSIEFIDTALFCTTPFSLSYADPDQKWLIREHLISLLQEFPSLYPSMGSFIHNDGTTVELLNASGELHVTQSSPPIPITIWLHENYPHMSPIVHVSSNPELPIHHDHPFVDSAGVTTTPYLYTWSYNSPRCNLLDLAHNLVKLFALNHPFYYGNATSSSHPSLVSKMEAIDRLSCMLHYDTGTLMDKTADEIEELSTIQAELVKRKGITTRMMIGLENERVELKRRAREFREEDDVLTNWLRVNGGKGGEIEDVFEAVGEDSKLVLEWLAGDMGLEDVMYALDKAVERGVVSFEIYIKQVRILAREQFFNRAKLVKLKGPQILDLSAVNYKT